MFRYSLILFFLVFCTENALALEMVLHKTTVRPNQTLRGEIKNAIAPAFDVEWIDSYGRVCAKTRATGAVDIPFELKIDNPITRQGTIRAKGVATNENCSAVFKIKTPPAQWTRYKAFIYKGREIYSPTYFNLCKKMGITGQIIYPGGQGEDLENCDSAVIADDVSGLGQFRILNELIDKSSTMYSSTNSLRYLKRSECLHDKKSVARQTKWIENRLNAISDAPVSGITLTHAPSLTKGSLTLDVCFSNETIIAWRGWLKNKYRLIDKLNSSWETEFSSWNEVVPFSANAVRETWNEFVFAMSPWLSHTEFMEESFFASAKLHTKIIRDRLPYTPIGITSLNATSVYGGIDISKWSRAVDWVGIKDNAEAREVVLGLNYARLVSEIDNSTPSVSWSLWRGLLQGDIASFIFWENTLMTESFTETDFGLETSKVLREFDKGISSLISGAKPEIDPVIIILSKRSSRALWMYDNRLEKTTRKNSNNETSVNVRRAWMSILGDLGITPRFIDERDVYEGKLNDLAKEGKAKIVILPMIVSMSGGVASELEEYVSNGGVLVADALSGLLDENGRLCEESKIDALFGIRRDGAINWTTHKDKMKTKRLGRARYIGHSRLGGIIPSIALRGLVLEEPSVVATLGIPLAKILSHPALIVNPSDNGMAVFLNISMLPYLSGKDKVCKSYKQIISSLLKYSKVNTDYTIYNEKRKPLTSIRLHRLEREGVSILGIMRIGKYNSNTNAVEVAEFPEETITLETKRAGHLYNIRTGIYLGAAGIADVKLSSTEATVLALIPYKLKRLKGAAWEQNRMLNYDVQVVPDNEASPITHIIRMEVSTPNGKVLNHYTKILEAKNGSITNAIPLALNDPDGVWNISFTDIITGIKTNVSCVVSENK